MRKFFVSVMLVFCTSALFAKITQIQVSGLRKTKDDVVQKQLDVFIGQEATEENLHAAETILQSGGLFSKVDVSFEELSPDETIMKVHLEEKISVIPIPFIYASSNSFAFGGFFLNMNVFGRQNMLMLGGLYSQHEQTGMIAFAKRPDELYKLGFSAFGNFSHGKETVTDSSDETVFEYNKYSTMAAVGTSIKLPANFTAGLSGIWHSVFSDDINDYHLFGVEANINVSTVDWNGWFLISRRADFSIEQTFTTEGNLNTVFESNIEFQYPIIEQLRLKFDARGKWNTDAFISEYARRGDAGVSVLPENFYTPRLAGAKLGIEYALSKSKFATYSLYTNYQVAAARDWDCSACFAHGPEAGFVAYLSQIAIPALSFGFSYNVPKNLAQFAFSLGGSF